MRPKYESQNDLANERDAALFFAQKYGCDIAKLPVQYRLDFSVVDQSGDVVAFVEVKRRFNAMRKYCTCILSLSKLMAAIDIKNATKKNCYFLVHWDDAIGFVELDDRYKIKIGGRMDRGDWQDVEPVIHIPVDDFKVLENA